MKLLIQILLVVVLLFVLYWALSAAVGVLIYFLIVAGIVGLIVAILRHLLGLNRKEQAPNLKAHQRAERDAERALKEMERKVDRS